MDGSGMKKGLPREAREDELVGLDHPSIHRYLVTFRKSLVENGILETAGENLRFSQNYSFDSPSTAAGVVQGRSANGRIDWKDEQGRTLKDIQTASI